jgi:hypothetical protein
MESQPVLLSWLAALERVTRTLYTTDRPTWETYESVRRALEGVVQHLIYEGDLQESHPTEKAARVIEAEFPLELGALRKALAAADQALGRQALLDAFRAAPESRGGPTG